MRTGKAIWAVLLLSLWWAPAVSGQEAPSAPAPVPAPAAGELVIGGNLKVGMPLKGAIELLGVPGSFKVNRGNDRTMDSIEISYVQHGLVIRALTGGTTVEAIEIGPTFAGSFASGIRLGDKFPVIIEKYGVPTSLTAQVARYPDKGLYFLLNNDVLLSAKTYAKNTKLLDAKLINP